MKERRRRPSGNNCYNCKKEGHFLRDCPQLKKKDSRPTAQRVGVRRRKKLSKASIGASAAAHEAGMYIEADVHGSKVKLLVDTGATDSIISERVFDSITPSARPRLTKVHQDISTTGGDKLHVVGRAW
ncbi:uncharacterized protein [Argopecten irradians]|uniref:uncharacterized protein n=1 Tax=Argopecten irradians TaxID=31199 RepID=UPI003724C090